MLYTQVRRSAPRIVSYTHVHTHTTHTHIHTTRTHTHHTYTQHVHIHTYTQRTYRIVSHVAWRSYLLRIIVQHTRRTHVQRANARTHTRHDSGDSTGQYSESILHFHDVGSNLTYRITISDTHRVNETDFLLYPAAKKIVHNTLLIYMSHTYIYITKNFLQYFFLQLV